MPDMKNNRKTKIVCTIGPASRDEAGIEALIEAGMNVARLNFSHGSQAEHAENIQRIRAIAERLGKPVAILQDLAGPKIRIGDISGEPARLESGKEFVLTVRNVPGDSKEVTVNYGNLPNEVKEGDTLLLADGTIELTVKSVTPEDGDITCLVVVGGELTSRKGINLPSGSLSVPIMSEKDASDLAFGIARGVDYVALSFVRNGKDVEDASDMMKKLGGSIPLIAKIEKHEAIGNIDDIISLVDGIMVARGDLGVETPLFQVPQVQKMLIQKAADARIPVITATQMLRSMVDNPRPTRAEVTDVANAILDGTDAVMLSEETAIGLYPVEAVEMMARIAADTDAVFPTGSWQERLHKKATLTSTQAVAHAACQLASDVNAAALITCTHSGSTARLVSKYRPSRTILAPTPEIDTFRRMSLYWGVVPIMMEKIEDVEEFYSSTIRFLKQKSCLEAGRKVVMTAGVPLNLPGTTNLIRVDKV
jgi:pyruvate kinase